MQTVDPCELGWFGRVSSSPSISGRHLWLETKTPLVLVAPEEVVITDSDVEQVAGSYAEEDSYHHSQFPPVLETRYRRRVLLASAGQPSNPSSPILCRLKTAKCGSEFNHTCRMPPFEQQFPISARFSAALQAVHASLHLGYPLQAYSSRSPDCGFSGWTTRSNSNFSRSSSVSRDKTVGQAQ